MLSGRTTPDCPVNQRNVECCTALCKLDACWYAVEAINCNVHVLEKRDPISCENGIVIEIVLIAGFIALTWLWPLLPLVFRGRRLCTGFDDSGCVPQKNQGQWP